MAIETFILLYMFGLYWFFLLNVVLLHKPERPWRYVPSLLLWPVTVGLILVLTVLMGIGKLISFVWET